MVETIGHDRTSMAWAGTTRLMGVASCLIGGMVLFGWAMKVDILTRLSPGLVSMKPNAALAFVLAGSALCALQGNARARRHAFALASLVATIGGLTFFEYLSGISLGIDGILASEPPDSVGTLHPSRMHPTTAFNFMLIGLAIGMVAAGRGHGIAQTLALVAGLVAGTALIGYMYGVRRFIGLAIYNQMALHTAVGMLILTVGLLLARPDRGLMAPITADTAGDMMAKWLLPVAFLVPILLNGLTLAAQQAMLFDEKFAAAIRTVVAIALFFVVIGWAAHQLHRFDLDRRRSSEGLHSAYAEMEERVLGRTAELASANEDLRREVNERRKAVDELRRGELRYRSLLEATTAMVWDTPASGEFVSDQHGWSGFTGQTFDQLKGWGWLDAIHPDDQPETARVWAAAVASRSFYVVEHRLRRHDGEYRSMMVRAVPVLTDDGTICEWIGVHTDIDDQVRAKEALWRGKAEAEAATRSKSEFLANMSHEIRTPMNGILGMTELALDTELTAEQREFLGLVKSSADSLLTVLNDILDFSKIEAGRLDLDPFPFGLRDCMEGTLKTLALRAHAKGLELSVRVEPGLPDMLLGDAGRLHQVIVNLVGNAIKFTESGEVAVSVEAMPASPSPADLTLHLSVRDTGIGIPADKLQSILEPFTQADGSTTRKYGGTGLGLAISLKLVELMGGALWVESAAGSGSTFHFTVRLVALPDQPPVRGDADLERLRDLPVLVVDDNPTNRRILEEILTGWGAAPTSVDGGHAALTALMAAAETGRPFPIVLLDGMMPDLDGYVVAERIAADPALAGTRIIMLTSDDGSGELGRRLSTGIAAKLTKPIRQIELFDALMRLLPVVDHHAAPASAIAKPSAESHAHVGPRMRGLNVLLADDHVVNQKVVTSMLEKQGHVVSVAGDGRQALRACARTAFDVVLMDVQMPEMDGFEAVDAIRLEERSTGRHLPIVALTAHAMKGDKERCLARGFDAYLSKPVRSDQLYATIDELMNPSPAPAEAALELTPGD